MSAVLKEVAWKDKVHFLVDHMGAMPQVDCPLKHHFAPGVYIREIFMPCGSVIIGKIHKTEHFNIIQKGAVTIAHEDGSRETLQAPLTFVSKPGVQKVLYIHEDTVWSTVHITSNRDLDSLEAELIEPDDYPRINRTLERLQIANSAKESI